MSTKYERGGGLRSGLIAHFPEPARQALSAAVAPGAAAAAVLCLRQRRRAGAALALVKRGCEMVGGYARCAARARAPRFWGAGGCAHRSGRGEEPREEKERLLRDLAAWRPAAPPVSGPRSDARAPHLAGVLPCCRTARGGARL